MMEKTRIKIYNYHSGHSIMHPIRPNEKPKVYDVEAYCVGGEEGVFATFEHPSFPPNCIGYAQGDDGHWWFAGLINRHWLPGIVEAFTKDGGLLKIGDIVTPHKPYGLVSSCSVYNCAVVVSVDPFILISKEGDMLWHATVVPEEFDVVGQADSATLEVCMGRLARDRAAGHEYGSH